MKRMIHRIGRAAALGAAAVSLTAGTGSATVLGNRPIGVTAGQSAASYLNPVKVTAIPASLDLGTLKAYRNQRRAAVVKLFAPAAGGVTAWMDSGKAIQVTRLSNYVFRLPGRLAQDQSVPGNGTLTVGQSQMLEVEVALQSSAAQPLTLSDTLFISGSHWTAVVPVKAFVLQQPEVVPAVDNGEVKIVPGGQASLTVHLNRTLTQSFTGPSGVNQDVTITARSAPAGVSIDPVTVRVPADALSVDAIVPFHANPGAPVGPGQATTLVMSYPGESQSLGLEANVYPTAVTWHYDQQIGDVHHVGDLTIRSDGTWKWQAHLHDRGTIYGDYYSVGAWVNLPYTGLRGAYPGGWATGQLGGGVFGGSQDADIVKSSDQANFDPYYNPAGPSEWLKAHYIEAVDAGLVANGNASDDPSSVMKWLFDKAASVAGGALGL
jgi:hypothetical protein